MNRSKRRSGETRGAKEPCIAAMRLVSDHFAPLVYVLIQLMLQYTNTVSLVCSVQWAESTPRSGCCPSVVWLEFIATAALAKLVIAPGAAIRYAPRRWKFDSPRIYVRPWTGPASAHG